MTNESVPPNSRKTMLAFAKCLPNLCSLTGLFCSIIGIYFAIRGIFPAAMIGMLWAIFFDWSDGRLARRQKDRTKEQQLIGSQFDSLIDIVSFGIGPAVLLLSYGQFSPWYLPGAFVIVSAGVIRLSYFNVFGLAADSTYQGMAIDNNGIILAFAFLFNGLVSQAFFAVLLYALIIGLATLNVAPIKTPKLSGRWYYAIVLYVLVLTAIYSWRLLCASG